MRLQDAQSWATEAEAINAVSAAIRSLRLTPVIEFDEDDMVEIGGSCEQGFAPTSLTMYKEDGRWSVLEYSEGGEECAQCPPIGLERLRL